MGIGISVLLLAIGAILAFAINVNASSIGGTVVQWDTVGWILMVIGLIGLVWALFAISAANRRRDVVVDDRPRRVID